MATINVADLRTAKRDGLNQPIACLYALKPPEYGVFRTDLRVMIQYADDPQKAAQQRRDLSALAPLRGEIDGLIDGWRKGTGRGPLSDPGKLESKARRYERRV